MKGKTAVNINQNQFKTLDWTCCGILFKYNHIELWSESIPVYNESITFGNIGNIRLE